MTDGHCDHCDPGCGRYNEDSRWHCSWDHEYRVDTAGQL